MAKGHNYDRICVSIPIELSNELRTDYPYVEFSSLITQMLVYAHASGYMTRLSEIDPAAFARLHRESLNAEGRKIAKRSKQVKLGVEEIERAAEMVAGVDTIEEFG